MKISLRLLFVAIAATTALVPASAGARQLYTNLYNDPALAALNIGADGTLSPVAGSPYAMPGYLQNIAITPDSRFLIGGFPFSSDNFLVPYALGPNGELGAAGTQLNTAIDRPLVVSPTGNSFYAVMDDLSLGMFSIAADGTLAANGTTGSGSPTAIAITPDARFLFAADYLTATIQRFAIAGDGTLSSLGTADAQQQGAQTAKITANGRVLIVTGDPAGSGATKSFLIGPDGSLTATGQSVPNSGISTQEGAITPNGQFYFTPNNNEDTISTIQVGANGELSKPFPDIPVALASPGEAVTSSDGRFLFVQSSNGDFFQTFAIAGNGALTPLTPPVSTGGSSDGSSPTPRPAQAPVTKLKIKGAEPGKLSRFDATGSADSDGGTITGYSWNFGDGTTLTTTGPTTTHRYKKAGDYDVSAFAIDSENCGGSDIFDGNIMYCNAGSDATASTKLDTPPAITKLRTSPKRFGTRKGTRVLYTLSEKARVTFTVQKPTTGRKVGKSCRKTTSKNRSRKRCTRYVKVKNGTFRANGKRGGNKVKFSGKLKKRSLANGKYRLYVTAVDSKKGRSTAKTTKFVVK